MTAGVKGSLPPLRGMLVTAAFFAVYLLGLPALLLWLVPQGIWLGARLELGVVRWAGLPLSAAGLAGFIWVIQCFAVTGRGTPAPHDPPAELVVTGPFRFVRNPMYLADLAILVGAAVWFESAVLFVYTAVLFGGLCIFLVGFEEKALLHRYGPVYDAYCARTPRFLPALGSRP